MDTAKWYETFSCAKNSLAAGMCKCGMEKTLKDVNKLRSGSDFALTKDIVKIHLDDTSFVTVERLPHPYFMNDLPLIPYHRVVDLEGACKIGSDTAVDCLTTDTGLEFLLKNTKDERKIVIVSGSHGNLKGDNWVKMKKTNEIVRNQLLRDRDMLIDDKARYVTNLSEQFQELKGRIKVIDVFDMNARTYAALLRDESVHVIQAFCYSAVDEIYRSLYHFRENDIPTAFIPENRGPRNGSE